MMPDEASDPIQRSIELMLQSFDTFKAAETELALGHFAAYDALTAEAYALRASAFKLVWPDD